MMLSSKGSRGTCIPQGVSTFLHAAFTAHRVAVVVRGWESQPQGEGPQVKYDSRGRGCETRDPEAVERAHWRAV